MLACKGTPFYCMTPHILWNVRCLYTVELGDNRHSYFANGEI